MSSDAVQARFDTNSPRSDVLGWLTDVDRISGWWTDSVTGSASAPGDVFHARFPTTDVVFDLEVAEASEGAVEWHIPESPPWWKGTIIRFDLGEGEDGKTSFLFTHRGFDEDDPIVAVITPAWVRFLDRLVEVAESGEPNPVVVN
jgi:hypothetical protein